MIHTMPSTVDRSHKRLGRGHGSGRGKTSGRGTKGQKARGTIPPHFEGGQLSVMKRLPYLRGKQRNKSHHEKPARVKVEQLAVLDAGTKVTLELLKKHNLVPQSAYAAKILGNGKLAVALNVQVACSEGAKSIIEKAGGTVA
jgi:large subunit ribosomal protein L15